MKAIFEDSMIVNINSAPVPLDKMKLIRGNTEVHISSMTDGTYGVAVILDGHLTDLNNVPNFPVDVIDKYFPRMAQNELAG